MHRPTDQLISIFTHELRSRINAILGLTELCLETDLDQEQREMLQTIHGSTGVLFRMMETMIDITALQRREERAHAETPADSAASLLS